MPENKFYVYVYLDIRKPGKYQYGEYCFDYEPFYVGKGKGNRYLEHIKIAKLNKDQYYKSNLIRKIIQDTGKNPLVIKIKENISNKKSIDLEIKLISLIGRKDKKEG